MHLRILIICFLINQTNQDNDVINDIGKKNTESSNSFHFSDFKNKIEDGACHQFTGDCNQLNYPCIKCETNDSCHYGVQTTAKCRVVLPQQNYMCRGSKEFERNFTCQYCFLTEEWEHNCVLKANCNSVNSPKSYYKTNCTVKNHIICLGNRTFLKNLPCNWTGGLRWSSALLFSLTLGGFGADRFYLGYWQEGIGKLFSFGGLGVWTIIDFVLIAVQYLGPADGSLYI